LIAKSFSSFLLGDYLLIRVTDTYEKEDDKLPEIGYNYYNKLFAVKKL